MKSRMRESSRDTQAIPTEVHNKHSNLPTFAFPTLYLGSPHFNNPTLRNFEPRIGFSWDPSHAGKTAVREAFGMFEVLPPNYEFFLAEAQSAPFAVNLTAAPLTPGSRREQSLLRICHRAWSGPRFSSTLRGITS